MYSCVLVALDGAQPAVEALLHGKAIASAFGAKLVLLRVILPLKPDPDVTPLKRKTDKLEHDMKRSQAEGYLDSLKRSVLDETTEVETLLLEGDPADVILHAVAARPGCLLVLSPSNRTRSSDREGNLGSVAAAILRDCRSPVLLVRR